MNGLDLDLFLRLIQTDFAAWLMLAVIVLGLVVTVWAGVGSHKALRKCIILSIVMHIVLMRYGQPVEWTRSGLGMLGTSADQTPEDAPPVPPGIRSLEILDVENVAQAGGSGLTPGRNRTATGGGGSAGGILPSAIPEALPQFNSTAPRVDRPTLPVAELALNQRVKREELALPDAEIAESLPVDQPNPEKRPDAQPQTPAITNNNIEMKTAPAALTEKVVDESAVTQRSQTSSATPLPTPADVGRRPAGPVRTAVKPDAELPKSNIARSEVAMPKVDIASNLVQRLPARPMPESRSSAQPGINTASAADAPKVVAQPIEDLAPPVPVLENAAPGGTGPGGNKPAVAAIASLSNPAMSVPDRDLRSRIRTSAEPAKPAEELAVNLPNPKPELALPKPDLSGLSGLSSLGERRGRITNRPLEEVPLVYRSRLDPNRAKLAIAAGASGASEKSVEMALEWLRSHQDADGRWDGGVAKYRDGSSAPDEDSFTVHCPPGDICFGECYYWEADTALTGLSLLAYLGAGYTHTDGKYADVVSRGLDFLIRSQKPDGDLRGKSVAVGMYCHAMAALAMCEAYALTGDERLKTPATKAIAFLVDAQAQNGAAWRYEPRAPVGDTSILGWVVLALRSGRSLGFDVPDKTIEGIENWLKSVSSGKNGGLAKYQPWKEVTPTMTAEAWVCRWFLDLDPNIDRNREASDYLLEHGPDRDPYNLYYWYYGTLSMYQNGGEKWDKWNGLLRDRIVGKQKIKGHQSGSWDPDDSSWGKYGGRVYSTALATLTLEVYYRFLRLYDEPKSQPSN